MNQRAPDNFGNISVIVPVYNEERTIGDVIDRIKDMSDDFEVIVIDDGSSDNSSQVAAERGVRVLRNPYNIGLGGSLKRGARESNGDILVFIDGDGQHPPEEIPKLLKDIREYNMVVGSRNISQQHYHRGLGNWLLCWFAERITKQKIPDLTTGFRCLKKKNFMEFIHLLPNGFSSATTLTIAMMEAGLFVKFVPIENVKPRNTGKSSIRFFRDGMFFSKIAVRIIMMFSPLKVFFPLSLVVGSVGLGMGLYDIITANNLQESTVLMVILSALMFSFGVMADYLAHLRRDISVRSNKDS